jgi:hypothetical protein
LLEDLDYACTIVEAGVPHSPSFHHIVTINIMPSQKLMILFVGMAIKEEILETVLLYTL